LRGCDLVADREVTQLAGHAPLRRQRLRSTTALFARRSGHDLQREGDAAADAVDGGAILMHGAVVGHHDLIEVSNDGITAL
jgi:hypothetical protein